MSEMLYKYRLFIIALSLLLFAAILWLLLSRQETAKIPSRGVFVMGISNSCTLAGRG